MIVQEKCVVVRQLELADSVYELILSGDIVSQMKTPGQFVHVKVMDGTDPLLRRPISIASIDQQKQQFTIIYRIEGRGTSLLAEKKGGEVVDVLGPLGNGFPTDVIHKGETALLIGGGVGTPPLYELSKQLVAKGVNVIHVLGFETKSAVFYEAAFSQLGQTYVATVDGTAGVKGFVTDVIDTVNPSFSTIFSCGPVPMLAALQTKFVDKPVYISLEERMACGIGACFACVCQTKDIFSDKPYRKVCSDGPVFLAGEVLLS